MNLVQGVKKAATKVKDVSKTAVKKVGQGVKKAATEVKDVSKKVVKKVGQGIATAAQKVKGFAEKAVKSTSEFVKKFGGMIKEAACKVIRQICKPACSLAINGISFVASKFGIPVKCVSDALLNGCNKLCDVVCKKRRLTIRRNY